ncbi:T9SS type A sorting domain-containing protein [Dyadobacter alkalitolerans]|uniref:T9SS type A sorting domain-containing protein n=1 Tax=Dyadobacter alkalitolerans TaxID=492736 RepID=UPI00041AA9CE|nr:T9SS type A sorting domain-containing protein [Dyadobacter alkalitolerans]
MKQIILAFAIGQRAALRRFLVLLPMLLLAVSSVFAQTTWNGSVSADWGNAQNWSNGVPDASADVIITAAGTAPAIDGNVVMRAKSVLVQPNSTLTIGAAAILIVSGSNEFTTTFTFRAAMNNLGHVVNAGGIKLGTVLFPIPQYAIVNQGAFDNKPGARIHIDAINDTGIYNTATGTFNNEADIFIGVESAVGFHGIWNEHLFNNQPTGNIEINRSRLRGIVNYENTETKLRGSFTNEGKINIGALEKVGDSGIENTADFINEAGGVLIIDRAITGIFQPPSGDFTNKGKVVVGTSDPGRSLETAIRNQGDFFNLSCAELSVFSALDNNRTFRNAGLLYIQSQRAHPLTTSLQNTGILTFSANSQTIGAIANNGIIITSKTIPACGGAVNVLTLGSAEGFNVEGIFSDAEATVSAGTYHAGSNAFEPAELIAAGIHTLYIKIGSVYECTRIVPWQLTVPEGIIKVIITEPTVVQPTEAVPTGSITIHTEGSGELEFSVNDGTSWSAEPNFTGLPDGDYNIKVRSKISTSCEVSYAQNPVKLRLDVVVDETDVWTGAVSSEWANAQNWRDKSIPTASNGVVIPNVPNLPVIDAGTTAVALAVKVDENAALTIEDQANLTLYGSLAYESLASGAEPSNFTAALNNLGTVTNSGTLLIGWQSSAGIFGIVNQGTLNNNAGGNINVDRSEDTGIFNAAGVFTNAANITIGSLGNVGNHGIWNDATFTNQGNGHIKIDRSSLRAIKNNADPSKSISASFDNSAAITIGDNFSVGVTGIENLASFNNSGNGEIKIQRSTGNGFYNASGNFINEALIFIGGTTGAGDNGIANWGNLANNASGSIYIDRAGKFGLFNAAGTLNNNGKIIMGEVASGGNTGIENHAVFNNKTNAEIHIDHAQAAGIHHLSGSFTNEGTIVLGRTGNTGTNGIWTKTDFTNTTSGKIYIDRAKAYGGSGLNHINGVFNNSGEIRLGMNGTSGMTSIFVDANATLNNNSGAFLTADRSSAASIEVKGFLNNAGRLQIGSLANVGNYGLYITGTVNNNLGTGGLRGEIQISNSEVCALYILNTLINNADISIGAAAGVGTSGMENQGIIRNKADGHINIDRSTVVGLTHVKGTFENAGTLSIGANHAVGPSGFINQATFQNLAGGTVGIDRTFRMALRNDGTFSNAGHVTIGALTSVGATGLETNSIFNNNAGGHIRIDNATDIALSNAAGIFTNEADIIIGAATAVGRYGLVNRATFNSNAGHIRIDRSSDTGLYESSGIFTNKARITIGASEGIGVHGIFNEAAFLNIEEGNIQIDRTTVAGLRNFNGNFTNEANIAIGTNDDVGTYGIWNQAAFANNAGGNIRVDNAAEGIFVEDKTFANAGTINIGGVKAVGTLLNGHGSGNFSNDTGGNFKATGQIAAAGFTNAGGTLSPGYSPGKLTFNESQDFSNSIMDIEINGAGIAGVDYDQIEVLGTATLGGTLKVTVNYSPVDGDEIEILKASAISGQFSSVSDGNLWRIEYSDNAIKLIYDSSLPVNLVEFDARPTGSTIQLSWRTAAETDNAGFQIERSSNGVSWQDIGFVVGNGTVSAIHDYHFQDINPISGLNYYRLRQIDFDGKTQHSSIQVTRFEGHDYEPIVWADEARQAHIKTEHMIEQVTVFDLSGRIVGASKLKTLDLSHVNGGLLLVRIQTSNRIVTKKLLLP